MTHKLRICFGFTLNTYFCVKAAECCSHLVYARVYYCIYNECPDISEILHPPRGEVQTPQLQTTTPTFFNVFQKN